MADQFSIAAVLAKFPGELRAQGDQIEPLGNAGGFSGAAFWRLRAPAAALCLRRWPRGHPSLERLAMIHAVLAHVQRRGFQRIPVPFAAVDGATCVAFAGHLWELTPWLPGAADYHAAASIARLENAMRSLAEFHLAAATFPYSAGNVALSPGLSERLKALQRLTTVDCGRIAGQLAQQFARPDSENDWPELTDRAQRLIPLFRAAAPAIERELKAAAQRPLPLQPGIRDIWHDHVLFVGQQVSGIIDFGALRIESPVGDVARLLGSLARDDAEQWRSGLAAYEQVRPLATDERRAVGVFDRSGVLLSGLSWLRWICLEQRRFDDRPRVLQRIDEILLRLERLGPSTSNTAGV